MIMMNHEGTVVVLTHRQLQLYDAGKPVIAKVMGLAKMRIQKRTVQ